jgi:hypothetical protein
MDKKIIAIFFCFFFFFPEREREKRLVALKGRKKRELTA